MAIAHKVRLLSLGFTLLLLQQHLLLKAASRQIKPHTTISMASSRVPKPPSISGFTLNRYKMVETDAYRPTAPGHSPGIGHEEPPGAP
ncbi:hypothetical protein NMG60_11027735 [Bertholletia excelsa]